MKKMKKIIIIGSRQRNSVEDYLAVYNAFRIVYDFNDVIISGGCPKGADHFAEQIAERHGMTKENGQIRIHLPVKPNRGAPKYLWARAMFDRNTIVAGEVEVDSIVIASIVSPEDGIESVLKRKSGGTEDTLRKIAGYGRCENIMLV
jgi:hypothetical protein